MPDFSANALQSAVDNGIKSTNNSYGSSTELNLFTTFRDVKFGYNLQPSHDGSEVHHRRGGPPASK